MEFIKVIYFDESSVTDLLQIVNGGSMKTTTDFITDIQTEMHAGAGMDIQVNTNEAKGITKVFSFLSGINVNANAGADAEISRKKDKVVKNILENTILTDFVKMILQDGKRKKDNQKFSSIQCFNNLELHPGKNTFAYLMLIAPYMNMMDGKLELDGKEKIQIDVSKIEETMIHGRGYYEFIGIHDNKEVVFRFNFQAFRNNYTMSDLTKMDLSLYAIKVGKTKLEQLDMSNEFEFGTQKKKRIEYGENPEEEQVNNKVMDVYDVLLAGIKG